MRAALAALVASGLLYAADLGRPSPPLSILQPAGPTITVKQYLGKTVLLAFIETPSMECQSLIPLLAPISKDYAPRGVQVLVAAFDETAAGSVPGLIERFKPPFPVGWTHPSAVANYFQESGARMEQKGEPAQKGFIVPRLVFIDRKGVIRGDFPADKPFFKDPAANIRSELNEILR